MRRMAIPMALCYLGLSGASAWAQDAECKNDEDCKDGAVCEVVGASGCAGLGKMDPTAKEPAPLPPDCEVREFRACVPPPPPPCDPTKPDACVKGERCVTYSTPNCAITAACEGESCKEVMDTCAAKPESVSMCVPAYQAPCKEDKDCGSEGFVCTDVESCACATEPAPRVDFRDGNTAGSMGPSGCDCRPTGEKYCQLREIPCDKEGRCPDGLTCNVAQMGNTTLGGANPAGVASAASGTQPAEGGTGADDASAICKVSPDGKENCPEPVAPIAPPPAMCMPKDWVAVYTAEATSDVITSANATRDFNARTLAAAQSMMPGTDDVTGSKATSTENAAATGSDDSSSGCSVGSRSAANSGWGWMALLALAYAARRRRG